MKPFIADRPKYKDLGSVYMEKSCPGKEGQLPSRYGHPWVIRLGFKGPFIFYKVGGGGGGGGAGGIF